MLPSPIKSKRCILLGHDATLAEMARSAPATLDALAGISGVGARKLGAYGQDLLRLLESV